MIKAILITAGVIVGLLVFLAVWCCLCVSSRASRTEEEYWERKMAEKDE